MSRRFLGCYLVFAFCFGTFNSCKARDKARGGLSGIKGTTSAASQQVGIENYSNEELKELNGGALGLY